MKDTQIKTMSKVFDLIQIRFKNLYFLFNNISKIIIKEKLKINFKYCCYFLPFRWAKRSSSKKIAIGQPKLWLCSRITEDPDSPDGSILHFPAERPSYTRKWKIRNQTIIKSKKISPWPINDEMDRALRNRGYMPCTLCALTESVYDNIPRSMGTVHEKNKEITKHDRYPTTMLFFTGAHF